jgi:hypothetical protein
VKLKHWILLVALVLFVLAVCGWIVDGARWTLTGGGARRRLAQA